MSKTPQGRQNSPPELNKTMYLLFLLGGVGEWSVVKTALMSLQPV